MADPILGNARDIPNDSTSIPRYSDIDAQEGIDIPSNVGESGFPDLSQLRDVIEEVDIAPMVKALTKPAGTRGRRPYPRGPIIRALLSMPVRGIADISALREELLNNPAHRAACGFTTRVPSRSTFSRVFGKMGEMRETLEELLAETADRLSEYYPDLGREVAVDSTMVKTNSNPNRTPVSDPDADWGLKRKAGAPGGEVWVFGFKVHAVADANHDIPFALAVTAGNQSDTTYLPTMVEETSPRPEVVIADRGYDSRDNNEWLHRRGIAPVIHKRRHQSGFHTRDKGQTYSERGTPLCECGHERPYLGADPETGERVYGPLARGKARGLFQVRCRGPCEPRRRHPTVRRGHPKGRSRVEDDVPKALERRARVQPLEGTQRHRQPLVQGAVEGEASGPDVRNHLCRRQAHGGEEHRHAADGCVNQPHIRSPHFDTDGSSLVALTHFFQRHCFVKGDACEPVCVGFPFSVASWIVSLNRV